MSEMIERVARAIAQTNTGSEANWKDFCEEARAAIEAMRVPTDAMAGAGANAAEDALGIRWGIGEVECATVYSAMIDAALQDAAAAIRAQE